MSTAEHKIELDEFRYVQFTLYRDDLENWAADSGVSNFALFTEGDANGRRYFVSFPDADSAFYFKMRWY